MGRGLNRRTRVRVWVVAIAVAGGCQAFVADRRDAGLVNSAVPTVADPDGAGAGDGAPPAEVRTDARHEPIVCEPHPFSLNTSVANQGAGNCSRATCQLTGSGAVLSFCIDRDVATGGWSWATCSFSRGESLTSFDIDHPGGGHGILEARVCVEGPPPTGGVNLWYGKHPRRKRLTLFRDGVWKTGEPVQANQCKVLYFTPAEAIYPNFKLPDGSAEFPPEGCPQGDRCGRGGSVCIPPGGLEPELTVAAEFATRRTEGRIRIEWVRLYPASCHCRADDECSANEGCVQSRVATDGGCAPGPDPRGVCVGCIGAGEACTVTVGTRTCQSSLACAGGKLVCPCAP